MMQLDLFAPPPAPPVAASAPKECPVDEVAALLMSAGYCGNEYLLTLGGCHPPHGDSYGSYWDLPSRMMQFPIETTNAIYEDDGQTHVYLRHTLLADHPWVVELQDMLGGPLEVREGYGNHADWWHAVDLGTKGRWDDLLDTEQFTTRRLIGQAVAHCLQYRHRKLTTNVCRNLLARIEMGEPEPSFEGLCRPSVCDKRWPINGRIGPWALIHGIERGHFKYRGEFLEWSETGRAAWEAAA